MSDDAFWEILRASPQPTWVHDRETLAFLAVNDAALAVYGWARDELLRMAVPDLLAPGELPRLAARRERARGEEAMPLESWRQRRRDGAEIEVEMASTPLIFAGRPARLVVVWDVTARHRAERELRRRGALMEMLGAVAAAANEAVGTEQAVRAALEHVSAATGWPVGHAFLVDGGGVLRPTGWWRLPPGQAWAPFVRATESLRTEPGAGLRGRAVAEGAAAWLDEVPGDDGLLRRDVAEAAGLRGGVAVPVLLGREVAAVLEFYAPAPLERDPETEVALGHVAAQVARVLERGRAADALLRSERLFRSLIEQASDLITVLDAEGTIVYESPSAERVLGFLPHELVGRSIFETVHPDDRERLRGLFDRRVADEGYAAASEGRFRHRDGSWRLLESVGRNRLADPDVRGVVFNSRDVTGRRATEAELRDTAAELGALLAVMPDVVVVLDRDGRYLKVAATAHPLVRELPGEMVGRSVHDVFPPDTAERVVATVRQVLDTWRVGRMEYPLEMKGGRYWFSAHVAPLRDDAVVWVAGDATERRRAQEKLERYAAELERSNRELQEFAYVASHDLQEPLRKIQAFGDRLAQRSGEALDDAGRDYLARMQGAAARMQRLIQDLLSFARVATQAREMGTVDLEEAARDALGDLSGRAADGGTVEVGPLPPARGDAGQVRRVFQNLLANALKFHRPGVPPRVRVTGRELAPASPGARPRVEVTVSDEGIGFDERHADRIFGPFQRLHGREAFEGTGMGLAICRRILERHGGTITAHGRPGEGSAFVFTLSAAPPEAAG
ncbi:MAG: hypothetical protein JWM27_3824 [Gemmatimonadetes bacterium]|nr:hypothetical protein [Gemmatimonadota bacterium]